jgi:type II secretory pathway pseudopilin PulG
MQTMPIRSDSGFTLLETVVATGVLVTALAGLAQLLSLSVRFTRDAGVQGAALAAAQDKLEVLRSLVLVYASDGTPITHPSLTPSPPVALHRDVAGLVDYLDHHGRTIDDGTDAGAALTRRWRVAPLDDRVPDALLIEVCVFHAPAAGVAPAAADACLATVRVRQP